MNDVLYKFSGHNKIAIPLIYRDNYDWDVTVYRDCLVITRNGRLRAGLQTKTTIYFQDVTDIQYYTYLGYTWIIFAIPGIDQSTSIFTTANVTKNISVTAGPAAAEDIPYSNTYAICNYSDKNQTLKKHFEIISEIFAEYRKKKLEETASVVMQVQESTIDKVKKLKELLDMGIITSDEYEKKRRHLISQI